MTINSLEVSDKSLRKPLCVKASTCKRGNFLPLHIIKTDLDTDESIISAATSKYEKLKQVKERKAQYHAFDRVHLLSRMTEKRIIHKKGTDFVSSLPLAASIYKANSDYFTNIKGNNKNNTKSKKSVLTLPNEQAPLPQACTVSDINDSEYFNQEEENRSKKIRKERTVRKNKKIRNRKKESEFFSKDTEFCSRSNIDCKLNCSTTNVIKNFKSDLNKTVKKTYKEYQDVKEFNAHDVWAVLRNINRFQFMPSPPLSENSIKPSKKKKIFTKRRNYCKDTRYTCRTEEFAYISNIAVDSKSVNMLSQPSSFDRITVIDKNIEFNDIYEELGNKMMKSRNSIKGRNQAILTKKKTQINQPQNSTIVSEIVKINESQTVPTNSFETFPKFYQDFYNDSNNQVEINKETFKKKGDCIMIKKNNDILTSTEKCSPHHYSRGKDKIPCLNNSNINLESKIYNKAQCQSNHEHPITSSRSGCERGCPKKTSCSVPEKSLKLSSNDSCKSINKITNVVLSKGQEIVPFDPSKAIKRKPRLVTTMPNDVVMPKLTQTELKRQLAKYKFPLVVLGRDQISSKIEVPNYEPPQFYGLDKHIWPFMTEWSKNIPTDIVKKVPKNIKPTVNSREPLSSVDRNRTKITKVSNEIPLKKSMISKTCTELENKLKNYKKVEYRQTINKDTNAKQQQSKNMKTVRQFKDKMLKLLYKKSSTCDTIHNKLGGQGDANDYTTIMEVKKRSVGSQANIGKEKRQISPGYKCGRPIGSLHFRSKSPRQLVHQSTPSKIIARKLLIPTRYKRIISNTTKYPKAIWTSEFIENVIKKIKSGVYYSQENERNTVKDCKEAAVQTLYISNAYDNFDIKNKDPLKDIPGFDETLPSLEIKTLNMNQIAVKHCITNVILQFDVRVFDESNVAGVKSSSCVPIKVTESDAKIFKCKTSLLNAMLPAELCSILPKLMRNIIKADFEKNVISAPSSLHEEKPICPLQIDKANSYLPAISEISLCENHETCKLTLINPLVSLSPTLKTLSQGVFRTNNLKLLNKSTRKVGFSLYTIEDIVKTVWPCEIHFTSLNMLTFKNEKALYSLNKKLHRRENLSYPYALQPYTQPTGNLISAYESYNFLHVIQNVVKSSHLMPLLRPLEFIFNLKNIELDVVLENKEGIVNSVSVIIKKQVNPLYKESQTFDDIDKMAISKKDCEGYDFTTKGIEYISHFCNNQNERNGRRNSSHYLSSNKTRKKSFVKLYKKCKSASNIIISGEKCTTSLTKITNLDEFFQVLGLGKMLSSVFDGFIGKRILASIMEMKNWVAEISSRQAMLVLLLMNKKDTRNLVRFRPLILQGIAVNRITTVSELDMEIEVIERENFSKLSKYDGISYLPVSTENYDNLLEELHWIAKTTASDYQRPFDESSERHLRSLLQKRKQWNPSYLRVMARYVGLGLLKSPK